MYIVYYIDCIYTTPTYCNRFAVDGKIFVIFTNLSQLIVVLLQTHLLQFIEGKEMGWVSYIFTYFVLLMTQCTL